jgi:two-component sensor histidine kinase
MDARVQRHRRQDPHAEILLREAYHRIRNHLQLLVSLIGMRAREHEDPLVREELMQVRRRILAVARLHGELQQLPDEQGLEISQFLERIREDLRLSFMSDQHDGPRLTFEIDHAEMESETAVTLALIITELVTNAMKYAIRPDDGEIKVRLKRLSDGTWRLLVTDDGPGMPPGVFGTGRQHGLDLARLLARKLRGGLTVEPSARGAAISLHFS